MKKSHLLSGILVSLLVFTMTACSSDNDSAKNILKPGDDVYFQYLQANVPYSPVEINELPSWLQSRVSNPLIGANRVIVYAGSFDGETVYDIEPYSWADNIYVPRFWDKEGNMLDQNQETDIVSKINNWKCVYYVDLF